MRELVIGVTPLERIMIERGTGTQLGSVATKFRKVSDCAKLLEIFRSLKFSFLKMHYFQLMSPADYDSICNSSRLNSKFSQVNKEQFLH